MKALARIFILAACVIPMSAKSADSDNADTNAISQVAPQDDIDYNGDGVVDSGDLARATQNPVSDLISLPLQNNFLFDTALGSAWNLNIQPVIPFHLNDDWNVISRTILPVLSFEDPLPGMDSFGIGDTNATLFFSPAKPSSVIWGVGPALSIPTASNSFFGSGQWSAGPSVVVLTMKGPWVVGALAQNIWSIGGWSDREVNQLLTQPFINYNMSNGWYLTTAPIITANWEAPSDEQWTVPLGGGLGKIFKVGDQPMNVNLQGYYNVEHPTAGAGWSMRLQIQLLFPK